MKSQIKSNFYARLRKVFFECTSLLYLIVGEEYENSGNIGIFSQSENEHIEYMKIAKELTKPSDNPNQKYFELIKPIVFNDPQVTKPVTMTHLYIRKFDPTEYGRFLGDIDFVTSPKNYEVLKKEVGRDQIPGAAIYKDRPGWDMIELTSNQYNVVAYITTMEMAKKVRVKFDDKTNL